MSTTLQTPRGVFRALVYLSAGALIAGLAGCKAQPERAERTRAEPRPAPIAWEDDVAVRPIAFEQGRPRTELTAAGTSASSAVIDGTLRITMRLPREVRAGNVFQYELTVENVTDLMLGDVVIRQHDAGMDSPGHGGMMMDQPGRGPGVLGQPGMQPRTQPMMTPAPAGERFIDDEPGARPVRQELDQPIMAPIPGQPGEAEFQPVRQPLDQPMQPGVGGQVGGQEGQMQPMDPRMLDVAAPQQQQQQQRRGPGMQEIRIGNLGPRESRTVTVTGSVPTGGEFVICTSAAYTPMVCAVGVAVQPELALTKVGPEFAAVGETIQYQLTVTNTGIGTARDVRVLDPLPGPMRTTQGQAEARFDVGTLGSGQSRTFTVTAVAPEPGRYTNIARVVGADGLWDEAQAVTVIRAPRLQVTKIGPELDYANVGVTFEIAVTNVGDMPAQNVVLEDIVPQGARLIDASEGARTAADRVTWDIGTLAPEETRTVLVRLEGVQPGILENCVVARADRVEPVRDCWTVRLEGVTGLLLELVDTNDPIRIGENEIYAIRVTNQGTAAATAVEVDVQLDPRMELVSTEGASPSARTADGLTFAALPSLAPGASVEWRVVTRGVGAGDTRFRVALRAAELERPVIAGESTRVFE